MAIMLYMNQHVPRAITVELRLRGVDMITAHEDGADRTNDPELLDRASVLGRVLFTRDDDSSPKPRADSGKVFPFEGRYMLINFVFQLELASTIWKSLRRWGSLKT
jgi:uncharacterized protein DUF5615